MKNTIYIFIVIFFILSTSYAQTVRVIDNKGTIKEIDGSITNELQNLFETVTADTGTTTADTQTDTINIVGSGTVSTSLTGDTLTITGTADGTGTDDQTISTNTTAGNISIQDGNTITLNVDDADADATNEIQTITSTDGSVSITPSGNDYNLSVAADVTTAINNTVTGHKIADYTNETPTTIDINETVTSISQNNLTGVITYTDENGANDDSVNSGQLLNVVSTDTDNAIQVGSDGGAYYGGYEKIVIWAEENNLISGNQQEWSYGNGATGQIGIPLVEDWEIYGVALNGDISSAGGPVTIEIRDNTTATAITTFTANGTVNNFVYTSVLATPVSVTAGATIGFRTVSVTGNNRDFRVAVWLRRRP